MIIVDTNIIAYLYLEGEYSNLAGKLLLADPDWAAPILWRSEFQNVLALYIRNGSLSVADALLCPSTSCAISSPYFCRIFVAAAWRS